MRRRNIMEWRTGALQYFTFSWILDFAVAFKLKFQIADQFHKQSWSKYVSPDLQMSQKLVYKSNRKTPVPIIKRN